MIETEREWKTQKCQKNGKNDKNFLYKNIKKRNTGKINVGRYKKAVKTDIQND